MSQQHSESILSQTALARLRQSGPGRTGRRAARRLFTSDLSVNEFALLNEAGFSALGLVMGSSMYHIGYQFQTFNQSQEIQVLTQAMYTAREYAMARMEAEADILGADGIVGVRLDYRRYPWADELLEFMAVGTAVRAATGTATGGPPPASRSRPISAVRTCGPWCAAATRRSRSCSAPACTTSPIRASARCGRPSARTRRCRTSPRPPTTPGRSPWPACRPRPIGTGRRASSGCASPRRITSGATTPSSSSPWAPRSGAWSRQPWLPTPTLVVPMVD